MKTYLFTWNSALHPSLPDDIERIYSGKKELLRWSAGTRRHLEIGERFLLIRLGKGQRGIVGCGTIESKPYEDEHWREDKRAEGISGYFVQLRPTFLTETPVIFIETLKENYPGIEWSAVGGGGHIPDEVASAIFDTCFRDDSIVKPIVKDPDYSSFLEGMPIEKAVRIYDRNPRARTETIRLHGLACKVCKFDFGEGYIEAHHLRPLSSIGEEHLVDPFEDLRPVCANCHRMLHRREPCLSIQELQGMMNSRG